jgi:hypothetical protein
MFDHSGEVRSLHARSVLPSVPPGEKAAAPAGAQLLGLVFADDLALRILSGAPLSDHPVIVIAEGEPDWMAAATHWPETELDVACFGVVAGSWTERSTELARRIPTGARVIVWTHQDPAGDKYARRIHRSFTGCKVHFVRGRPPI